MLAWASAAVQLSACILLWISASFTQGKAFLGPDAARLLMSFNQDLFACGGSWLDWLDWDSFFIDY